LRVHAGDHVRSEVDDPLEVLRGDVEQVAQPRRDALEVPDVRDRRGQLDVAHPLPSHLGPGDLHAAPLADDPLEPDPLVLPAVALPVAGGTEDPLAEQAVTLGLEGAVVDGLRLLHLAVGPGSDLIVRGQADPELVKVIDVKHLSARCFRVHSLPQASGPHQSKSAPAGSRLDRSMPSSSAARNTSSSVSRISISLPSAESTSTFRHRDCISLISTL